MNEVDTCGNNVERGKGHGNVVIGATLVLTGLAIVLERAGVLHWKDHWTLWPLILGGIGLARLLQSVPGEPKQGLLFLTAAVWLLLGEAGWVSVADSWPIVIIALGLMVALNGGRRRRRRWQMPPRTPGAAFDPAQFTGLRRPDYPMSPLAVLGIWIAIVIGLQVSGIRTFTEANADNRVRVVSVMGRGEHISRATAFQGADVTNVMGRATLDLQDATLAPGASAVVQVYSAMGGVVVRVPPTWTVDSGAISALGAVRDERDRPIDAEATATPAPRLVLRGLIIFGRLTITS
jgi:hypothetical protein